MGEVGTLRNIFSGHFVAVEGDMEHIDFKAILRPDIPWAEREGQLRYETDEAGNVLPDDVCGKRPRTALSLRKYASDLGLTQGQALGMTIDQIIKYIMNTEAELGFLVKEKKSAKKGPELAQEEKKMAEGKRILLPRKREAAPEQAAPVEAPAKGPEMVARPQVTSKVGRPPRREAPAPQPQAECETTSRGGSDLAAELVKFLLPEIQVRVGEVLEAKLAETVNRIVASVTKEVQKAADGMDAHQTKEAERILGGITALHDLMAVNGLIQWVDPDAGTKTPLEPLLPDSKTIMIYVPE
jgi:hypothetical protein